jgi:hypothetical protein
VSLSFFINAVVIVQTNEQCSVETQRTNEQYRNEWIPNDDDGRRRTKLRTETFVDEQGYFGAFRFRMLLSRCAT